MELCPRIITSDSGYKQDCNCRKYLLAPTATRFRTRGEVTECEQWLRRMSRKVGRIIGQKRILPGVNLPTKRYHSWRGRAGSIILTLARRRGRTGGGCWGRIWARSG